MPKDTYIPRDEVVDINNEFNKVRKQAEEELMKIPGVMAVGVGLKEVKGEHQRIPCFKVTVKEKKAKKDIKKTEIVPAEIFGFKTDITEPTNGVAIAIDSKNYRPLIGGSQIEGSGSSSSKGTLGCFATRNSDNKIVILSAWHVMVGSPDNIDGDRVGQPTHNGCCSCCASNEIGKVTDGRFRTDNLDAAIALLDGQDNDTVPEMRFLNEILEIGAVAGSTDPLPMETVFVRGRTGGKLIRGQITHDNVPHSTQYEYYNNIIVGRVGQFEITPTGGDTDYITKGDSGSVSVNEHNQVVLLNFSTVASNHTGYGSNIKTVETALGITILDNSFHNALAGNEGVLLHSNSGVVAQPSLSENLAELETELRTSREGMRILELFKAHRTELLNLVRHKREVMAAWNRYQGPSYLAHIAKNIRREDKPVPDNIKGITMQSLLLKMAAVLQRNGSPALSAAVSENYLEIMNILSAGRTHHEWKNYLQQLDHITYA
ncbi:MAG: hypothetical protein IT250_00825 [Chitinophagaceae bacterium]|nr:hypothetical protein [Chitinophagaceae bacterium]